MRRLVAVAMGALAPFAVVGAALAAKPVIETERVDETDTIDCGTFTLEDHVFGTIKHRVYTDRAGNPVRELHTISLRHVTTNPTTGESLTTRDVGADRVRIFPDNSATVTVIGLVGRIVVPGRGVVAADVGRLVLFFESPTDQEPDILFESGRHDDLQAAVCEVLAP